MFLDTRLGNTPQWFFDRPKDWAMRVPERIRKSVVFFARRIVKGQSEEFSFRGTGFIVSVPSSVAGREYRYVVTARHVVDQLLLGDWVMRLNTASGQAVSIQSDKDHKWWLHPTEKDAVDVAVTPFPMIDGPIDATAVPASMFLDDKRIAEIGIGPGDEVFITGLFSKMTKHARNLPIVRVGNVALIPGPGELVPGVKIGGAGWTPKPI